MQFQEQQTTLLAKADTVVRDLLEQPAPRGEGGDPAQQPRPGRPARGAGAAPPGAFRDRREIRWATPTPQPAPKPLVDRAAAAVEMLYRRDADDKWLVVVSDFQKGVPPPAPRAARRAGGADRPAPRRPAHRRRHPRRAGPAAGDAGGEHAGGGGRRRPAQRRAAGERVGPVAGRKAPRRRARPRRPTSTRPGTPGCASRSRCRPAGGSGSRRPFSSRSRSPGRGRGRTCSRCRPGRSSHHWQPRTGPRPAAGAPGMDPSEGQSPAWALSVRQGSEISADTNVVVLMPADWPDAGRAGKLLDFVRGGGTLIWFVRPGLEQTWAELPEAQKQSCRRCCPAPPPPTRGCAGEHGRRRRGRRPRLLGLTDARYQLDKVSVYRYLPTGGDRPARDDAAQRLPRHTRPRPARRRPGVPQARRRRDRLHRRDAAGEAVHDAVPEPDVRPDAGADVAAPAGAERRAERGNRPTADAAGPKVAGEAELRVQGPQNDVSVVKPAAEPAPAAGGSSSTATTRPACTPGAAPPTTRWWRWETCNCPAPRRSWSTRPPPASAAAGDSAGGGAVGRGPGEEVRGAVPAQAAVDGADRGRDAADVPRRDGQHGGRLEVVQPAGVRAGAEGWVSWQACGRRTLPTYSTVRRYSIASCSVPGSRGMESIQVGGWVRPPRGENMPSLN